MNKAPIRRPAKGPRVAIAQIEPILGDVNANLEKHREAVLRADEEKADLLVFPELSLTGYRLRDTVPDVAVRHGGEVFDELAGMSENTSLLVGLVAETATHAFYNSAAYFEDGKLLAVHHKAYLPTYGMFDEQRYFARGDQIRAFDTKHARTSILICEDMLHPSAAMIAALDGAVVLLVPSASPVKGVMAESDGGGDEVDANGRSWEAYNRAMAPSFGVFIVYANRVGVEDGQTFWGGSEIIGPDGSSLAKAAYYDPDFVIATLPMEALRERRIQAPVLRDENVDLTINELCRIRGRSEPARPAGRDEGERRGRDSGRPGEDRRFGGGRSGGPPRYDRRHDDRREGDRREGSDRRFGGSGDSSRYDRRDDDRRGGGDRRYSRRDDERSGGDRRDEPRERDAPTRTRPDARARTPRSVGRGPRRRDDTDGS
jgi:predicted amidohydrolase